MNRTHSPFSKNGQLRDAPRLGASRFHVLPVREISDNWITFNLEMAAGRVRSLPAVKKEQTTT
jgi:hypothetical protein